MPTLNYGLLKHSMFADALFPKKTAPDPVTNLNLKRSIHYHAEPDTPIKDLILSIFDLETTGLQKDNDKIIEIGAIRVRNGKTLDQFHSMVDPQRLITKKTTELSKITQDMLVNQPLIEEVFPKFLDFISGSVLVAHNANFDIGFIQKSAEKLDYDLSHSNFCTWKMAREVLPASAQKNLDSLAAHYGLNFEARHRSIGDAKVTRDVLELMLAERPDFRYWRDLEAFQVSGKD